MGRRRLIYGVLAAACLGLLAVGAGLRPSPRGFGTHTQLGLPACGFFQLFGVPCPSCGMTTAFALAVRGRLADAAIVQPFGLLLFFLVAAATPVLLYWVLKPPALSRVFDPDRAVRAVVAGLLLYGAGWAWKVASISGDTLP